MADDFTEQLNAVLGNPEAMGQIMSIARALTGDGNAAPPQARRPRRRLRRQQSPNPSRPRRPPCRPRRRRAPPRIYPGC
jgi:hypothetical protein